MLSNMDFNTLKRGIRYIRLKSAEQIIRLLITSFNDKSYLVIIINIS